MKLKKKFVVFAALGIIICFVSICIVKSFRWSAPDDIDEIYDFCVRNHYNTTYCCLVDFSRPSGQNRFYIYNFKEKRVVAQSLCAHGLGKRKTLSAIFGSEIQFSNVPGSNYSSLGKYKIGIYRKMKNEFFGAGYEMHGLDATNSNAHSRAIMIHSGNSPFPLYPLPCIPVSSGCFGVSSLMVKKLHSITSQSKSPVLLYAYK